MSPTPSPPSDIEFRRPERARRRFAAIGSLVNRETLRAVGGLLRPIPDPDTALDRLDDFIRSSPEARRQVQESRRSLQAALILFSHSNFLSNEIMRRPELLAWALDPERFYATASPSELYAELGTLRRGIGDEQAAAALARFRRAHILRIALRDLLGAATLPETALALSNLADAVLQGAHDYVHVDLVRHFGRPLVQANDALIEGRFVAIALGKLGGRELNYSSDIDVLYLHTGQGQTAGPVKTTNHDFYRQLATRVTALLSRTTPDGFAYRVDLRLRPEGSSGELVAPLEGALAYYHKRARDWELQMLIKARPAAGDLRLGESFLQLVEPLIYRTTTDFSLIERVSESRDRIHEKRRLAGRKAPNVKLARGGIRDIEFLVQCLQRLYGGQDAFVRSGGTMFALHRLCEKSYITLPDYGALVSAYRYLRTIEHRLQLVDDRQVHEVPASEDARADLARRLGLAETAEGFDLELSQHFAAVAAIYERTIHAQSVSDAIPSDKPAQAAAATPQPAEKTWLRQLRQIELHSPALARHLDEIPIRRGGQLFEFFLDKVAGSSELAGLLESSPDIVECVGDLIEHSPYAGEHLVRFPEDVAELAGAALRSDAGENGAFPAADRVELEALFEPQAPYAERSMLLRRFYRRKQLRILARSVCGTRSIFETLAAMSDLAQEVIRAAYRIARDEVRAQHPEWRPTSEIHIIALGRLGIRELDLGSDVDLVFALPDEADSELPYWRDFAARFIELISNYTREGRIFALDARLRPNGRDGAIIQTTSGFKRYFAERAEAWEALAYMKARAIAGDVAGGRRFLMDLQQVGWDRFGRNADLATLLRDMRTRIENERGESEPIKAGAGGYFDIDFALLYLRLKSAGLFFELLSTPKRIAVLRKLGGLNAEQARFLEDAAAFFRSVDHAVRVVTGRPAGDIPAAVGAQESVRELVGRWSSLARAGQPLAAVIEDVKRRTRAIYLEIVAGRSSTIIPAARAPRG